MKAFHSRLQGWLPAALGFLLILAASAPAALGSSGGVEIVSYTVDGSQVHVQVRNQSSEPTTGMVSVVAIVNQDEILAVGSVALLGSQEATVTVAFLSDVETVVQVSATTDSMNPY